MVFSYVAIATKATKLEDLRHSESTCDLQQCLYLMCKDKIGILGTKNLFYYFL